MNFTECSNGINTKIAAAEYGKWGSFSQDAADLIIRANRIEGVPAAMLAVTLLNESVFTLHQAPNVNHKPEDSTHWDVGPSQLNVLWTRKEIAAGNVKALPEPLIFGSLLSPDALFDGDPLSNIRMCARRLLAIHTTKYESLGYNSPEEMRCVRYTGPAAQPFRLPKLP